MKKKTITLDLPDYLGVKIYQDIVNFQGKGDAEKLIHAVSRIVNKDIEEIKTWPVSTLKQLSDDISDLAMPKESFHAIVEFDNILYGYAHMKQVTLGEYIDLENLCKDLNNNMAAICAILYRPVTKHRFDSLQFHVKQKIKSVNNKVENPFDYYSIEEYNSETRKDREKLFESFPAHIFNGALGFFLGSASLYLNNILYSNKTSTRTKMTHERLILENLSQSIGDGLEPYTIYLNPISFQSQEIQQ